MVWIRISPMLMRGLGASSFGFSALWSKEAGHEIAKRATRVRVPRRMRTLLLRCEPARRSLPAAFSVARRIYATFQYRYDTWRRRRHTRLRLVERCRPTHAQPGRF